MAVVGRDCAEGRKWLTVGAPGVRMARLGRRSAAPVGPGVPGGPGRPRGRQQQVRGTPRSAPWPGPRRWVLLPRRPYLAPSGRGCWEDRRVSGGARVPGAALAPFRGAVPALLRLRERPSAQRPARTQLGRSPGRMLPRLALAARPAPQVRFPGPAAVSRVLLRPSQGRVSPSCSRSQQRKEAGELQAPEPG